MAYDELDRHRTLVAAREGVVDGGGLMHPDHEVPAHVLASWQRSLDHGVSPGSVDSRFHPDLDTDSRLVQCAAPVIDQLAQQLADAPMCIALTDSEARILTRRDVSPSFGRATDRVQFAQGFDYAEHAVGTNGVGTVLESGDSVQIVGAQHFVDTLHSFACAGAPVRDPVTRRIEGVLDISCFATDSTPILHSMVRTAALQIEQNLLADRSRAQQALFEAYSRVEIRGRAVIAVGPRMRIATAPAEALLGSHDLVAVQDHARFRTSPGTTIDDRLDLPSGCRVRLRGRTVMVGHEVAGVVCLVTPLESATPPPVSLGGRPQHAAGGSTVLRAAARTVTEALAAAAPVVVLGEPGSGRMTLLATCFAELVSDGRVVAFTPDQVGEDPAAVSEALTAPHETETLVVLRDLDRLPAGATQPLAGLCAGRTARLAATASDSTALTPLVQLFDTSTTVPPLRNRSGDLPGLVDALLADLAPGRDVRLTHDARRVVSGYDWPGNVTQLREALEHALARRPVGTVEVADLPAYCQSTPSRALTVVDRAERDAIVLALREHAGNRKAAAEALGIARSTLYRKLREYGISD